MTLDYDIPFEDSMFVILMAIKNALYNSLSLSSLCARPSQV